MKSKTINTILCKKFDDFLASITDPAVKALVEKNTIITGGSIVSLLLGDKVNDYDMYFRNKETTLAVAKYYVEQFKKNPTGKFKGLAGSIAVFVCDCDNQRILGSGVEDRSKYHPNHRQELGLKEFQDERGMWWYDAIDYDLNHGRVKIVIKSAGVAGTSPEAEQAEYQYFEGVQNQEEQAELAHGYVDAVTRADDAPAPTEEEPAAPRYQLSFMSSNAISLSGKVQLVVRFYGEPDQIHENYDFAHCTSYWTSWERKLTLRHEAMEAILSRELKYIGSRYPLCSIIRTRKFLGRGWTINAGQYVKMAWQLREFNLSNLRVLEDQLVGVDAAYFMQIISILRREQEKKESTLGGFDNQPIDGTYLMTLIDKLF